MRLFLPQSLDIEEIIFWVDLLEGEKLILLIDS
jgi:hypothetical protein